MKIIAIMPCRSEDWILSLSLRVVLKWVDEVLLVDHGSTDKSIEIVAQVQREYGARVMLSSWPSEGEWLEMHMRQWMLQRAREMGATHIGLVDCDEFVTANIVGQMRSWCEQLQEGQILALPMIPTWRSLTQYRNDDSVWSRSWMTTVVRDKPGMFWLADGGYHFHKRTPYGSLEHEQFWLRPLTDKAQGGNIHAQFANWTRLKNKHLWYKMQERVRWPDRENVKDVDAKYSQALDETGIKLAECPKEWFDGYDLSAVDLSKSSWHLDDAKRMWNQYGADYFAGLNLWGWPNPSQVL